MFPAEFAAARRERMTSADDTLRPVVREAIEALQAGREDWDRDLVSEAILLWQEIFAVEAPEGNVGVQRARFRNRLRTSLAHTSVPDDEHFDSSVERVTYWLTGYTVNDATTYGAFQRGVRFKRWTTMHDSAVRDVHAVADGQIAPISGTFDIAGASLHYPGEPVGPPEGWINCRCLAQPAARDGEAMSETTYTLTPEDDVEEENPDIVLGEKSAVLAAAAEVIEADDAVEVDDDGDEMVPDEPEEDEDLITEIPVHGVAAPEGVPTGDGRMFAVKSLSARNLPLPLLYQPVSADGHGQSVVVGRIDEVWRDEANMIRYRGAVVLNRPYASEVLGGVVDETVRGVSVDIDDIELDVSELFDSEGNMIEQEFDPATAGKIETQVFKAARISGLTIVAIPAFQEAFIALGAAFEDELSEEDIAALTACGCLQSPTVDDASTDELENFRAAAEAQDGAFRDVSAEERKRRAEDGTAMPDGSFPIGDCEDLRNAIQAIGRASDPDAVKAHIRKRKSALGCDEVDLPEDWSLVAAGGIIPAGTMALIGDSDGPEYIIPLGAEVFAPGTKDGPGWITHPIPTARIRRYWVRGKGAAKIGWGVPGDFNRCRSQLAKYVQNPDWLAGLCANMHKEALGVWPGQESGGRGKHAAAGPMFSLLASARTVYPREWFDEPEGDVAFSMQINPEDRRIFGYLAEWGTCHIGIEGLCSTPPTSSNDYAFFRKGIVDTTEGELSVGTLTYGIGHASLRMRASAASAHYDKVDAVRAYINVGENSHGIWYAGVLAPWVSDEDIAAMRAIGACSGDWRDPRGIGELDMIGLVVVNTPAFAVRPALAASAGKQTALVAAGFVAPEPKATMSVSVGLDAEAVAGIARAAIAEYRHLEKVEAVIAPAREKVRASRLAAARARVERG